MAQDNQEKKNDSSKESLNIGCLAVLSIVTMPIFLYLWGYEQYILPAIALELVSWIVYSMIES